ncbi:hypothetical protein [Vibrio fluvialis]|uniref:hypothetical protein n=1 Tax=Vibrio fluvialis TaxID=676 RepID=UPI0023A9D1CE|nr:hypothetical protein [Vibrio fluvialis]MDE5179165.1 hypothetical protein [Vibrio fluvialis]
MPKVTSINIKHESKSGEVIEFTSDITVDSQGVFAATFPEIYELDISANKLNGCRVTQPRKHMRVESSSMDDAIASINEGIKSLLSTEVKYEPVIWYKYENNCFYAIETKSGQIFPNASIAEAKTEEKYDINGSIVHSNAVHRQSEFKGAWGKQPFAVIIQAQVMLKVTYYSRAGERVEYQRMSDLIDGTRTQDNPWGSDAWTHLSIDDEFGPLLNGFNHTKLTNKNVEIPYTAEAAKFFYEAMLSMCALAHRFEQFFSDERNVMNAIANNAQLLAPPVSISAKQEET